MTKQVFMSSTEASVSSQVLAAAGHDVCEIHVHPFFLLSKEVRVLLQA